MSRELQHAHTMDQFKEVCHGTNCNASKAVPHHSAECKAEHDLAYGIKPSYRHDNPLRELEILRTENARLKVELHDADEALKAVEKALADVDYRGTYADGVLYLKSQLAETRLNR